MIKRIFTFCILLIIFSCNQKQQLNKEQLKIELGKMLFYDQQLSYNQTKSCSSCHDPKFAFTDGYKKSVGIFGDLHQRNSKPLFNLLNQKYLTAADSTIHTLEQQMNNPMFNQHPPELGISSHEKLVLERLQNNKKYDALFKNVFNETNNEITFDQIKNAIASFVKTIESNNSKYDKYIGGDKLQFNDNELSGMRLFFGDRLNCSKCHGGKNFDTPIIKDSLGQIEFYFNTGIYNIDGFGGYPKEDVGMFQKTKTVSDMGKFKVPTLRNLVFTTPYYHDGSESKLTNVIEDYNNGGRKILTGINKGDGSNNKHKHFLIKKLGLTNIEKLQLISFLQTLTDSTIINNKNYQLSK